MDKPAMKLANLHIAAAALGVALIATPAHAALIIDIDQVGSDVVATMSGSIDMTDLVNTNQPSGNVGTGFMESGGDFLSMQSASVGNGNIFAGITGPATFGTDTTAASASSSTGGSFDLEFAAEPLFFLPDSYVSGNSLSGTDTWAGTTLAALGLTPGASYDYTWGSGAHADSLVINIEPTSQSVPEPVSMAMFAAGLMTLGLIRRRRTR
jgi:hypothetical protein